MDLGKNIGEKMRTRQDAARSACDQAVDIGIVVAAQYADRQLAELLESRRHARLDGDNIGTFDETLNRAWLDTNAGAMRHVVQNDGPLGDARNLVKVPANAVLIGANVGWRGHQISADIPAVQFADFLHHVARIGTTDTDYHRQACPDHLEQGAQDLEPFAMIEQRRFAGRTQRDETTDLLAQIAFGLALERVDVDLSVLERRDNR